MNVCEFRIIGMRDEQCLRTVTNAIQDLPAIAFVEIALETGKSSVGFGSFVSESDILQAVEDAGFITE